MRLPIPRLTLQSVTTTLSFLLLSVLALCATEPLPVLELQITEAGEYQLQYQADSQFYYQIQESENLEDGFTAVTGWIRGNDAAASMAVPAPPSGRSILQEDPSTGNPVPVYTVTLYPFPNGKSLASWQVNGFTHQALLHLDLSDLPPILSLHGSSINQPAFVLLTGALPWDDRYSALTSQVLDPNAADLLDRLKDVLDSYLYVPSAVEELPPATELGESRFFRVARIPADADYDNLDWALETYVYGSDPDSHDTDGDGYSDSFEAQRRMNLLLADDDSDDDGLPDAWETQWGLNPNDSADGALRIGGRGPTALELLDSGEMAPPGNGPDRKKWGLSRITLRQVYGRDHLGNDGYYIYWQPHPDVVDFDLSFEREVNDNEWEAVGTTRYSEGQFFVLQPDVWSARWENNPYWQGEEINHRAFGGSVTSNETAVQIRVIREHISVRASQRVFQPSEGPYAGKLWRKAIRTNGNKTHVFEVDPFAGTETTTQTETGEEASTLTGTTTWPLDIDSSATSVGDSDGVPYFPWCWTAQMQPYYLFPQYYILGIKTSTVLPPSTLVSELWNSLPVFATDPGVTFDLEYTKADMLKQARRHLRFREHMPNDYSAAGATFGVKNGERCVAERQRLPFTREGFPLTDENQFSRNTMTMGYSGATEGSATIEESTFYIECNDCLTGQVITARFGAPEQMQSIEFAPGTSHGRGYQSPTYTASASGGTDDWWYMLHMEVQEMSLSMVSVSKTGAIENRSPLLSASQPSPIVSMADVAVSNVRMEGGRLLGDLTFSGTITSDYCDTVPGVDGIVDKLRIYVNDAVEPEREVPVTVSKQGGGPIGKPYPYSGTVVATTLQNIPLLEGSNYVRFIACDPVFKIDGVHEYKVTITGPSSEEDPESASNPESGQSGSPPPPAPDPAQWVTVVEPVRKTDGGFFHPFLVRLQTSPGLVPERAYFNNGQERLEGIFVDGGDGYHYLANDDGTPIVLTPGLRNPAWPTVEKDQWHLSQMDRFSSIADASKQFSMGFVTGMASGGVALVKDTVTFIGGIVNYVGENAVIVACELLIQYQSHTGGSYELEAQLQQELMNEHRVMTDAVADVLGKVLYEVGEFYATYVNQQADVIIALLTGDTDWMTAYQASSNQRAMEILKTAAELLGDLYDHVAALPPREKGYLLGRTVFEIASLFVAPELLFAKATKAVQLTKWMEVSTLFKPGGLLSFVKGPTLARVVKLEQTRMCFKRGTLAWTNVGLKRVEDVSSGTEMLSRDPVTGEIAFKRVLNKITTYPGFLLRITLAGCSSYVLETTAAHPFFVSNRPEPGFFEAGDLQIGDAFFLHDGTAAEIASIEQIETSDPCYNFEVADFHTYFVGECGVWVHNFSNKFCADFFALIESIRKKRGIGENAIAGHRFSLFDEAVRASRALDASNANFALHAVGVEEIADYARRFANHSPANAVDEIWSYTKQRATRERFGAGHFEIHHLAERRVTKAFGITDRATLDSSPGINLPERPPGTNGGFTPDEVAKYRAKYGRDPVYHQGPDGIATAITEIFTRRGIPDNVELPSPNDKRLLLADLKDLYTNDARFAHLQLWPATRDWLKRTLRNGDDALVPN